MVRYCFIIYLLVPIIDMFQPRFRCTVQFFRLTILRRDFFFLERKEKRKNGLDSSRHRFLRTRFNPETLLSSRGEWKFRAFTISSSFEQHSSNFFAAIKSSERRKWITLQKIAHSCQRKMRWINLPLKRESDASEKKKVEKRKKEENGGSRVTSK